MENELATIPNDSVMATNNSMGASFCSFDTTTAEGKKKVFRATSKADCTIKEFVNKPIKVVDVFARPVHLTDEETGEVRDGVTVVFFDTEGTSYAATSAGIYNATKALLDAFGHPSTWDGPITIIPKEQKVAKGNMLTFDII